MFYIQDKESYLFASCKDSACLPDLGQNSDRKNKNW